MENVDKHLGPRNMLAELLWGREAQGNEARAEDPGVYFCQFSLVPLELSSERPFELLESTLGSRPLPRRHACVETRTVLSVSRIFFRIPHFSIEVLGRWGDGEL